MGQSKGFGVPEIIDAEVDGEIVTEDGAPVAAAAVAEPKAKAKVCQSNVRFLTVSNFRFDDGCISERSCRLRIHSERVGIMAQSLSRGVGMSDCAVLW